MGRVCDICGKGMIAGNKVSHSLRHTRRTWKPNLRRVRANVNGTVKRINKNCRLTAIFFAHT